MMVRTRFAPSPTGYLHIGGVRTALFNWLFARQHGGQFLLRIDDTDAERNVAAALQPILHGFEWLGIDWDEGPTKDGTDSTGPHAPYFQSQRGDKYRAAVEKLLASGHAYRDYADPAEIVKLREAAEKAKQNFVYPRDWAEHTSLPENAERIAEAKSAGRQAVVRLFMPREGTLVIDDLIRGQVEFQWANESDHVIQRADGTCLYHLASVVDDYDMQISHVIRAEEHLSNTPRQIFIAQSLGYELPRYAHLPYVAEPGSKTKLSKRKLDKYLKNKDFAAINSHGQEIRRKLLGKTVLPFQIEAETIAANKHEDYDKLLNVKTENPIANVIDGTFNPVIVDFYEQVGYLPHAIINYLLLLGWSLDGATEYFSRKEMIKSFSLERVNKAPASFDPKKLMSFQGHYFDTLSILEKAKGCSKFLRQLFKLNGIYETKNQGYIRRVINAAGSRMRTFGDIIIEPDFFFMKDEAIAFLRPEKKDMDYEQAVMIAKKMLSFVYECEDYTKSGIRADLVRRMQRDLRQPKREIAIALDEAQAQDSPSNHPAYIENQFRAMLVHDKKQINDTVYIARLAITGKTTGPGLYDCISILGKKKCMKRIEQYIHRLTGESYRLPYSDHPNRANRLVKQPDRSGKLTLFNGFASIVFNNISYDGKATIYFTSKRSLAIRAMIAIEISQVDYMKNIFTQYSAIKSKLVVYKLGLDVDVLLGSINYTNGVAYIECHWNDPASFGSDELIERVEFLLTNYHKYRGEPIARKYSLYTGRATIIYDGMLITIDSTRSKSYGKVNYSFTHNVVMSRVDGGLFTMASQEMLLDMLQQFLTFCRGFRVAPLLVHGYRANRLKSKELSIRNADAFTNVISWFPPYIKNIHQDVFECFAVKWAVDGCSKILRNLVSWYVTANSSHDLLDMRLLDSLVLLSAIANALSKLPDKGSHIKKDISSHAEYVCNVLSDSAIKVNRDLLQSMYQYQAEMINTGDSSYFKDSDDTIWEVYNTVMEYCEMGILRYINYNGKYISRLTSTWITSAKNLPWNAQAQE